MQRVLVMSNTWGLFGVEFIVFVGGIQLPVVKCVVCFSIFDVRAIAAKWDCVCVTIACENPYVLVLNQWLFTFLAQ